MYKYKTLFILSILSYSTTKAQIGIGTSEPHSSAIVEIKSTDKGFLPPRLTKTERNSIAAPTAGLFIYNTDNNCLQFYTGTYWFDPCCNNAVNSGVDALPILIRIDPTSGSNILRINPVDGTNAGTQASLDDYIYQISSSEGSYDLSYNPGSSESLTTHEVFQFTSESSIIPYKDKKFIKRVQGHQGTTVSYLSYDFAPDRQDEFEIFIVGKMDSTAGNITDFASFFASGFPSTEPYAMQLGVGSGTSTCTKEFYRLTYNNNNTTGSTMCGTTENRVSSEDGELHTFNITSSTHPVTPGKYVLSLYIDGNFIEADSTLDGHIKFEELKLFSNRNSDRASVSFIGELIFFDSPLSTEQKSKLNEFLVCKYGEE